MTVILPEELAPSLREAAERLVAECGEANPEDRERSRTSRVPAEPCYSCGRRSGPKGGHHLPDGTVVRVHRKCHIKLHRREKSQEVNLRVQRATAGLRQLGLIK